jgi:hypothetical protein
VFNPVQPPSHRDALELVQTAVFELDGGLRHQIPDRARDQHLPGTRFRGDARADVKREPDHCAAAHLLFTGVQPRPDLQPQRAHGLVDRGRATNPTGRRLEGRQQSVSRRHDLLAARALQLLTDGGVIRNSGPSPGSSGHRRALRPFRWSGQNAVWA